MKLIFRFLAVAALLLVIVPPAAFLIGAFSDETRMKNLMLVGTLLWFASAPLLLRRTRLASTGSAETQTPED